MMFKVSKYAYLVELTHSHLGLLTRHLGHLKPPRTFLTRHLFIDGHLLPSGYGYTPIQDHPAIHAN